MPPTKPQPTHIALSFEQQARLMKLLRRVNHPWDETEDFFNMLAQAPRITVNTSAAAPEPAEEIH